MRYSISRLLSVSLFVSCIFVIQGCGGGKSGPPRASVAGRLTIGGKAVKDVEVHFVNPDFPEHGSFAMTDADGKFKLVTGAVVGTNTVFFSKVEGKMLVGDAESGMDQGQMEAMAIGNENNKRMAANLPKQIIPAEYDGSDSKLTFPVPEGGTLEANFDL